MLRKSRYDAVVIGAGPNGLAAALVLAQAGQEVLVLEANARPGGGARSADLTLPGFVHDLGSSIHPLGAGSPFFQSLPLHRYGLRWIQPDVALAHPLDDGTAVLLHRPVTSTAEGLGPDGDAYQRLVGPLVSEWNPLLRAVLRPLLRVPEHPLLLVRFGLRALLPAALLARLAFDKAPARALLAGVAAHSTLPLTEPGSAAFGLVLAVAAHAVGWPMPEGGAQAIADALAAHLESMGGTLVVGKRIRRVEDIPPARMTLLDITPRQLLSIAGHCLPPSYRRRLERYRYGPAAFKIDYALDGPIPWKAPACRRAGTVHLGGTLEEIATSEQAVADGKPSDAPFVLLAQHTLFDRTRAPRGRHTAWTYCHVPNGCTLDMTARIERQIERYAPGFRDQIRARHISSPATLERMNENLVGGDINGGRPGLRQLLARPVLSLAPYRLPIRGFYLCSASTPPGAGVHGMCGYHAAQTALEDLHAGRL